MVPRPPISKPTYTLFPYPTLFRSARRLSLCPRSHAFPREPRRDLARTRRPDGGGAGAGDRFLDARLLWHDQPRHEGDLPALFRLVGRQPGELQPAEIG